jgi:hypothetical protein
MRDTLPHENLPSASLFFPSGERRMDLYMPETTSEATKRLRVDAPIFYSKGIDEAVAAEEPGANEALMGLASGSLIYYGDYFENNKLLRELAFERETRLRFGHMEKMFSEGSFVSNGAAVAPAGAPSPSSSSEDSDDDL